MVLHRLGQAVGSLGRRIGHRGVHKFGKEFSFKGLAHPLAEFVFDRSSFTGYRSYLPSAVIVFIAIHAYLKIERKVLDEEFSQFFNKSALYGEHEYHKGRTWQQNRYPWLEDEDQSFDIGQIIKN